MKLDIAVKDRVATVELLEKNGSKVKISIDDRIYVLDAVMVENGVYSILSNNKSYNVEIVENQKQKEYTVNTLYNSVTAEVIDSESKYQKLRKGGSLGDEANYIFSPMPGKVVKILVNEGDEVKEGTTVVIISAMKMESEYKVKQDRVIKEIKVKEGDNIESNQPLIIVE
ncbi:MAG: biotin/lipoyl-containing protein [Bacteroidota bacterium]|nr:biotin/lipoyl-containing protein [Bacteroidota bacterium]